MQKRAAPRPLVVGSVGFERAAAGTAELDAGASPGGGRLLVTVRVLCGARPGPRLAVLAGLRGDEASAIEAAREVAERIRPSALTGDLLIVPIANVVGFLDARGAARGQLERAFPGDPDGAAAERHAHALFHGVVRKSDLVVLLSAWRSGRHGLPHVRTDLSAPGALPLATAFGAALVVHERMRAGSLLQAALAEGRAAIQYDVGLARQLQREAVDGAVEAITRLLREYSMLRGSAPR